MANERAQGWRRCYLCSAKTVKEFGDWKIVENEYPYDKIAETHHMLTLKRHLGTPLTQQVKYELENTIRPYLHQHYDMIFENTIRTKSIPGHHHIHMITLRNHIPVQRSINPQFININSVA